MRRATACAPPYLSGLPGNDHAGSTAGEHDGRRGLVGSIKAFGTYGRSGSDENLDARAMPARSGAEQRGAPRAIGAEQHSFLGLVW